MYNKDYIPQSEEERDFLEKYDSNKFEKPSVTTDAVIFTVADDFEPDTRKRPHKSLQILMVKRGGHPFKNYWALPGGFLNMSENLDECVYRELNEEAGISNVYLEQLYTWGGVYRDPRTRIISTSYMALAAKDKIQPQAGDDAREAKWFKVERVKEWRNGVKIYGLNFQSTSDGEYFFSIVNPKNNEDRGGLAFDHAKIIYYALERLENKIAYTDIAFNLMPELFTLTDLQKVYEAILGRELLTANFRKTLGNKVIETDQMEEGKPWRPAKLFRFNHTWKNEQF